MDKSVNNPPRLKSIEPNNESTPIEGEAPSAPPLANDLWDDFWLLYPRHEARKDARKSWGKLSERQQIQAVVSITDWRQVWKAQGRDSRLIPLPATWLNGERWEDELPDGIITTRHASHTLVTVSPNEPTKATDLPDRVKTMLAKLRKI